MQQTSYQWFLRRAPFIGFLIILFGITVLRWSLPLLLHAESESPLGQRRVVELPWVEEDAAYAHHRYTMTIWRTPISPVIYNVRVDNCLKELYVNGTRVIDTDIPFCDYWNPRRINIRPYVTSGMNTITAVVRNTEKDVALDFRPSFAFGFPLLSGFILFLGALTCFLPLLFARYKHAAERLIRLELLLCALVLFCTWMSFWMRLGVIEGYDMFPHMEMVQLLNWNHVDVGLYDYFYSYHPPLGFLLPRIFMYGGLSLIEGIQVVVLLATLSSFLLLRAVLHYLGFLSQLRGIAVLYAFAAIPLFIYSNLVISLDSLIFAYGNLVLYVSVLLVRSTFTWNARAVLLLLLSMILAAALFTKFSGVLLLVLPILVAFCFGRWRSNRAITIKRMKEIIMAVLLAVAIAMPYYWNRYYIPEGTLFPSNGNVNDEWQQKVARGVRDSNQLRFFLRAIDPRQIVTRPPHERDLDRVLLIDTWKEFWVPAKRSVLTTQLHQSIALFWMLLMPFILLRGLLSYIRRFRLRHLNDWQRLGLLFLLYSIVQCAALFKFIYDLPWAGGYPGKGIYIMPVLWTVAYFSVYWFIREPRSEKKKEQWNHTAQRLPIVLGIFIVVHHLLYL